MSVSDVSVQASERNGRREARKRERHAERRRQIMQSARALLVQQGIENFTIAQVAAVASVSKPAVYYYFESKEDLVCELSLDVLIAEHLWLERAVNQTSSAADALAALVRARIDFYLEDRDSFRILHVWGPMLGLQPRLEASPPYTTLVTLISGITQRLVEDKKRQRSMPIDAGKVAELAWAMSQGIVAMTALGPMQPGDVARVRELRDSACRWLLDALTG